MFPVALHLQALTIVCAPCSEVKFFYENDLPLQETLPYYQSQIYPQTNWKVS